MRLPSRAPEERLPDRAGRVGSPLDMASVHPSDLPAARPARGPLALGALLIFATLIAYAPALSAGFIWNDNDYVTAPALRSWAGLGRIWFEVGATEQYYPVLHGFFWLQHALWGDAASGYHLTNILLHGANAGLLVAVLLRLRIGGAWLAGFIFALHPVCVESVAWVAEQKNTLSTLLYLLAALAYLRFDTTRRSPAYAFATALFVIALLSKSVTATLPAALLVVFWWQRGRLEWRRDVIPLLPWFVLGAAFGLFSGWVEKNYVGAEGADFALSGAQRALIAGRALWFYLGKLVWPANLMFIYPRWSIEPGTMWQWLFPVAALGLIGALWWGRRIRGPLAAALFFGGSLFPVLGFFNVYAFVFSFVTDHWQYLPAIGLIVLAAAGLEAVLASAPPAVQRAIPLLLLAGLGVVSFQQSRMYRDIETFYRTILARNPECWMAHNNLGVLLDARGETDAAIVHCAEAVRLKPTFVEALNTLGTLRAKQPGGAPAAIALFEEALRLNPNFAEAHNNLAAQLAKIPDRLPDALAHYERALHSRRNPGEVHYNLALELSRLPHRLEDAVTHFEAALRINPRHAEAHSDLAAVLARLGHGADAIAHYEEALRLKPAYAIAHNNLANELAKQPVRMPDALRHYEEALRLAPNFAAAHYNYANKLAQLPGREEDAARHYSAALELEPNFTAARAALETLRSRAGRE
jgi:protein O-mannosyl-transferase